MENKNKIAKIYGFGDQVILANIVRETKTIVILDRIGSIDPKYLNIAFNKETKQLYPKKDHKNCLVEFGTIPYFELIEDEK